MLSIKYSESSTPCADRIETGQVVGRQGYDQGAEIVFQLGERSRPDQR